MITSEDTYGQSTKEMYRCDIEDSLKQNTLYKNFEYFDDYSYGNSREIGVYFKQNQSNPDKIELYFFQPDGPNDVNKLINIIRWRKSGDSEEVGHKGGGNKRNIFGFKSDKTTIFVKLNEEDVLTCSVMPNKIYELSNSEIKETEFRDTVDKNPYISWPELKNRYDLPSWYSDIFNQIEEDSGIVPNYMIKMDILRKDVPLEYKSLPHFEDYLNKLGAKQYEIPIKFKNTILSLEDVSPESQDRFNTYSKEYVSYPSRDLVGFEAKKNVKEVQIYYHLEKDKFYLKLENDLANGEEQENDVYYAKETDKKKRKKESLPSGSKLWGVIEMYLVDEEYFKDQLNEMNTQRGGCLEKFKQEDFYGIYLLINNKLTNFIPVEGNLLGQSKNNNIKVDKSSGLFRMILKPNPKSCQDSRIFNALIRTEIIKALSGFLDRSPYQQIIKNCMSIYRNNFIKSPQPIPPPPPPAPKKGGIYFVYLGNQIYKFGMVTNQNNFKKKLSQLEEESIEKVYEFTNKKISYQHAHYVYTQPSVKPKALEERISHILQMETSRKITAYQSNSNNNEIREYFKCTDIDYLIQRIISQVRESD